MLKAHNHTPWAGPGLPGERPHRSETRPLLEWEKRSGCANLELVQVVAGPGTPEQFQRWVGLDATACWSVAAAADPPAGKLALEAWLSPADPDARWIMKENLKKSRLARMDPGGVRLAQARA